MHIKYILSSGSTVVMYVFLCDIYVHIYYVAFICLCVRYCAKNGVK